MSTSNEYSTNMQAYHSSYNTFTDKSDMIAVKLKWLDENIPDFLRAIKESRDNSQTLSILSIGTSTGQCDIRILGHLYELFPKDVSVTLTAVEPSAEALQEFKRNAEHLYTRLTMTTLAMTFQDYCSSKHAAQQDYDLVLFLGSLYYCQAEPSLLHSFHKELKSRGAILGWVLHEDSQYIKLNRLFHGTSLQAPDSACILHTTADLAKIAHKHAWPYKTSKYDYKIDVTDCLDESSEEGNTLIEFLIHIKDARLLFDEEASKKFNDALKTCSVEENDLRRYLANRIGVFIIHK